MRLKQCIAVLFFPVLILAKGYSQCFIFYDGFESGTYSPTWNNGSLTGSVTTTSPAVGTYRLEGSGGSLTHLAGFNTSFAPATPDKISWWVYPQAGGSTNYVLCGNSAMTATNCIVFSYYQGSAGNIRFVAPISYDYPAIVNTWYHIELENINWGAHTFDIYVNDVLQYTGFPFRSATQNDISTIHLYNYNSGLGIWDDIKVGGDPVILNYTSIDALCNGSSDGGIDLTASSLNMGALSYNWSNSATSQDISGLAAGNYSVVVTDTLGCMDSLMNINISEPAAINTIISSTPTSCSGSSDGSANISASGGTPGYTYLWSTSDTNTNINGIGAGVYYCTVTDTNSCVYQDSVTVMSPPPINIGLNTTNPSTCSGADGSIDAVIAGGTPGFIYSWSNSETTEDIGFLTAAYYSLMVTDTNGCTDTMGVLLTDPSPTNITLNIPEDTVCITYAGFLLTGESSLGGVYSGTGVSSGMFDPATAGLGSQTITYTYTDVNNCISSAQDIIVVNGCLGFENSSINQVDVFPNPATTFVYVKSSFEPNTTLLVMTNELGQILNETLITEKNMILNTSEYKPGIYLLHLINNTASKTYKVIITQ